jgi:hypothetical protein
MVADQNRTVHAFNGQFDRDSGASAIYYRQWSLQRGWTRPNDIILPPREGTITPLDVYLDQNGVAHLIFFAGQSGVEGAIYYTRAPLALAAEARSWMRPVVLDNRAGPAAAAALSGSEADELSVIYVGRADGLGIYETLSTDLGISWSKSVIVSLVNQAGFSPGRVDSYRDSSGRLHAVWTVFGSSGLGEEVLYSGRDSGTEQWSRPFILGKKDEGDYGVDYGAMVEHSGQLIAMYMDGPPAPAQHMRLSSDGGRTWSSPIRPFPQEGGNGPAVMLTDGDGTLHIILANRIDELGIGGMWHGTWLGNRWNELEMINARSPGEALAIGSYPEVKDAHSPNAVISQGNVLLTSWWHNIGNAPPAGYSYAVLEVSELPLSALPVPDEGVASTPILPTIDAVPEVADRPELAEFGRTDDQSPAAPTRSPLEVILLATFSPLVLIVLTFFLSRRRQAHRYH